MSTLIENKDLVAAFRARGFDCEEWMTGGGCLNVAVIFAREGSQITVRGTPVDRRHATRYALFCVGGWCEEEPFVGFFDETRGDGTGWSGEGWQADLSGCPIANAGDVVVALVRALAFIDWQRLAPGPLITLSAVADPNDKGTCSICRGPQPNGYHQHACE